MYLSNLSVKIIWVLSAVITKYPEYSPQLLVVVDEWSTKDNYSIVFKQLSEYFEITYKLATDDNLALVYYNSTRVMSSPDSTQKSEILSEDHNDDFFYDHVMFLAPSVNNFRSRNMNIDTILRFFDSGRNIYIGLDESSKTFGRDAFKEFGAELFPQKSIVSGGDKKSSTVPSGASASSVAWSSNLNDDIRLSIADFKDPIAYKGAGIKLDANNRYVFPILNAEDKTKATNPKNKDKKFKISGSDVTLVAGYQSYYNQRVVLSGSVDMCSDSFIKANKYSDSSSGQKSSNYQLCINMLKWNFQLKSVLSLKNVDHYHYDTKMLKRQKRQEYKLKDIIEVTFDVFEKEGQTYKPYVADDIDIEFIMLNPWVVNKTENIDLTESYKALIQTPDHNGVYKIKIDYHRPGFTWLHYETIAPVRVLNHNEFPVYSGGNYYLNGTILAIIAFAVIYTFSYLGSEEEKEEGIHEKLKID